MLLKSRGVYWGNSGHYCADSRMKCSSLVHVKVKKIIKKRNIKYTNRFRLSQGLLQGFYGKVDIVCLTSAH